MYPWDQRPDTKKPEPATNAVQIALDRRDNGGDATAPTSAVASPPLSRRSSAICTALVAGSGFLVSGRWSQGYMSYTRGSPDRERDLRPARQPAAGGRPAQDQGGY